VQVLILLVFQLNLQQLGLLLSHRCLLLRLRCLPPCFREDLLNLMLALCAWLAPAGAGIILTGRLLLHLQHRIQE
jgi:hypothetical protein